MTKLACKISKITKSFGPNEVLREVDLDLPAGKVTVLMGANGAGKSTLVKILCGVHNSDSGSITLFGKPFDPVSPADAYKCGVVTVHQSIDDGVIPDLDVASNLLIDRLVDKNSGFFLKSNQMRKQAIKVASAMQIGVDVNTPVHELGVADRQMIAIARAMTSDPKLLILDEPTSSLSATEAKRLFELLDRLRHKGVSILYISHRMSDIKRIADRIVTMRDGQISGTFEEIPLDYEGAVTAMLGQRLSQAKVDLSKKGDSFFAMKGFALSETGEPFDIEFYKNEVVAITGLLGSGKTAIASTMFGLTKPARGYMTLNGKVYAPLNAGSAINSRVFMCPKDRATNAVVSDFDITNNMLLPFFKNHTWLSFLKFRSMKDKTKKMISQLGIVCQSESDEITTLSGGNQQKVMVARWLSQPSDVLLLDEPFQGVDIKARRDIGNHIRATSTRRLTMIFVAELDEALEIADRILVLHEQSIVGDYLNTDLDITEVVSRFSGQTTSEHYKVSEAQA